MEADEPVSVYLDRAAPAIQATTSQTRNKTTIPLLSPLRAIQ
jgi:hypothetical protein